MEPIVRYGIKSRFDSVCALCGAPTSVGDRIYKLPDKRGGRKWVCAACRWEDEERVSTCRSSSGRSTTGWALGRTRRISLSCK